MCFFYCFTSSVNTYYFAMKQTTGLLGNGLKHTCVEQIKLCNWIVAQLGSLLHLNFSGTNRDYHARCSAKLKPLIWSTTLQNISLLNTQLVASLFRLQQIPSLHSQIDMNGFYHEKKVSGLDWFLATAHSLTTLPKKKQWLWILL